MVEWLDHNFFVRGPDSEDDKLSIAEDVFYPYLAMVILCLQKSKKAAEDHKVLGLDNCSFKDVHHQLSLLFDGHHDVLTALEAADIDATDSMAFPEQNAYRIFPCPEKGTYQIGKSK